MEPCRLVPGQRRVDDPGSPAQAEPPREAPVRDGAVLSREAVEALGKPGGRRPALPGAGVTAPAGRKEAAAQSPAVLEAEKERQRLQEELRLQEIRALMILDRQRWQQKILALLADLSTELFVLWQQVMNRRQKAMDDALAKWSKVLLGD